MKLQVRHRTQYRYTRSASLSHNHVCLQPRNTPIQRLLDSRLEVLPDPGTIQLDTDVYGNSTASFNLSQAHSYCDIIATSLVETQDTLSPLPQTLAAQENIRKLNTLHTDDALMAQDCLLPSPFIPLTDTLERFIEELPLKTQTVGEYASQLMSHIFNTFDYTSGFSNVVTPLSRIYEARKGVCQDFAHLAIGALRLQSIPTRYVSGYLETLPPPGKEKLQGADASHAWFSVFDCQCGWIDFDPTNNKRPDSQYITTAWGRDYGDVTPIKGIVYGGGEHALDVEVDVLRMSEATMELA